MASTTYYYRIYATNSVGQSTASSEASTTTPAPTAAPTGVTATPYSSTQINLSWTDAATNETGYRIERRLTSGTTLSLVANLAPGMTSYSDTGLTVATGYTYRVSAIAPGGALVSAATVAATTYAATAAPTGVSATPYSSTQINLSWTDAATNETGYRIERRLTSGTTLSLVANLAPGMTSYSDTGLTVATGYTYRVSAIAPGGALVSAATVAATTYAATAAPTGVSATPYSSTQINLSWTDAATNETGYRIERRLTSGTTLSLVANLAPGMTSYSDTGLTVATGYTYRVSAIAPGGALVSAATVAATTYAPIAAPSTVVATPFSTTQINLSWRDNATNETGYRVSRRQTSGTTWSVVANIAANVTSYQNTGLTPATGYAYVVTAIRAPQVVIPIDFVGPPDPAPPGTELVSAPEVAATTYAATAAPTNHTATAISATQINLRWTDAATNETGYKVSRRLTSGTVWTDLAILVAGATTYSNTGLTASTGYTYRVSAIAPGGALVSGAEAAATTSR